ASAGVMHWLTDGRQLFDFTSGVLVANLGHNPAWWVRRVQELLGWQAPAPEGAWWPAPPLNAYNAVTPLEIRASQDLLALVQSQPGGERLERIVWAASGSEAVHKALRAALSRDPAPAVILATRHGFHGKKGLAGAVTGCETDPERDPRVRFISFPMAECRDIGLRDAPFDPTPYRRELDALVHEFGRRIGTLITEPYLGGG